MLLIINGFHKNPHRDTCTFHWGEYGFLIVFSPHLYKDQFNIVYCGKLRQTLVCETKNELQYTKRRKDMHSYNLVPNFIWVFIYILL